MALLGVSQVLPRSNTVNAAVIIGDHFLGPSGALTAALGLMAIPLTVPITLVVIFGHLQGIADVHTAIDSPAWAAANIVIGIVLRMLR